MYVFLSEICKRSACAILFLLFSFFCQSVGRHRMEREIKAREWQRQKKRETSIKVNCVCSSSSSSQKATTTTSSFVINNPQQQQQPQTSKWSMAHFLNAIDLVTCAMMTFRSYCLFYSAQKQTRRLDVSQKDKKSIGGGIHLYG